MQANRRASASRPSRIRLPLRSALAQYRSTTNRNVANDAAQATGLPPNVDAWLPLGQFITDERATIAPSGSPLAIPLARQTISLATPQCSEANILPVRPIP